MAAKANIFIDQGSDFSANIPIIYEDGEMVDLSNYTGRAHIKKSYSSVNYIAFDVSLSSGYFVLNMSSLSSIAITPGRYVYDAFLDIGTISTKIVEGIVTVRPRVTSSPD